MTNSTVFSLELALEVDASLAKRSLPQLSDKELADLQTCFAYPQSEPKKQAMADLFSTLSREELVSRAASIARLNTLLVRLQARKTRP